MNKKLILIMSFAMISMHISGITDEQLLKLNNDLLLAVGRTDITTAKKLLDQGAKPRGRTKKSNDPSRDPMPLNFAKTIIKNSKVNVFLVKDENQLAKYVKQNIYGKKIVIGMGAGSITNWIRNLPKLI